MNDLRKVIIVGDGPVKDNAGLHGLHWLHLGLWQRGSYRGLRADT